MDEYCELVRKANEPEVDGGSVIVRHPHGVVAVWCGADDESSTSAERRSRSRVLS